MTEEAYLERNRHLLYSALSAAIPLWVDKYRDCSKATLERIARNAGAVLAEKGDQLLFRSKKRGQTAEAFNNIASGIAAAALATGQAPEDILRKLWGKDALPDRPLHPKGTRP